MNRYMMAYKHRFSGKVHATTPFGEGACGLSGYRYVHQSTFEFMGGWDSQPDEAVRCKLCVRKVGNQ